MRREVTLRHEFVEFIPEPLEDGVIYISIPYATASHNCCCGCGMKVVTPLSPTDWKLTFDGKTISLNPSIGNWSLPCRSHYWIVQNRVRWAEQWTDKQVQAGRAHDAASKQRYYGTTQTTTVSEKDDARQETSDTAPTLWERFKSLWS